MTAEDRFFSLKLNQRFLINDTGLRNSFYCHNDNFLLIIGPFSAAADFKCKDLTGNLSIC